MWGRRPLLQNAVPYVQKDYQLRDSWIKHRYLDFINSSEKTPELMQHHYFPSPQHGKEVLDQEGELCALISHRRKKRSLNM